MAFTRACCSVSAMEKCVHKKVRGLSQTGRALLAAVWISFAVTSACLPLMVTRSLTFFDAEEECRSRNMQLRENNPDFTFSNPEAAIYFLLPLHYFNMAATAVSLFCGLLWLFGSPHFKIRDDLDRALGTFCMIQIVGNVCVSTSNLYICTNNFQTYQLLINMYMLSLFGISVLGSNLFAHRYMLEKAKIMAHLRY